MVRASPDGVPAAAGEEPRFFARGDPAVARVALKRQVERVRALHARDMSEGAVQ